MGQFIIEGGESLDLIQYVFSNDVSKLEIGGIQYGCFPNDSGGIVDDLLVYKLEENKFLMVVNASNIEKDFNWVVSHNTFDTVVSNISDEMSLFALQGPKANDVLAKLAGKEVTELEYYTFGYFSLDNFEQDVFVSATGYTGSGGFEIMIENKNALKLWENLLEAGQEFEIEPIGLGARDTLRLEKGYCLYGNDIDDTTSPLEAGLSWVVKLNKKTVASGWLEKQKAEGVSKKLVGFAIEGKGIPRSGYSVLDAGKNNIGTVTSGSISPCLGYGIGLAYVDRLFSKPDTEILIEVRNKYLTAKVVKMPFL